MYIYIYGVIVENSCWECQFFEWRIELLSDQGWRPEGIGGNWQNLTSQCHPTVLTYDGTVSPNLAEFSKHPFDWEAGFPIKRSMIIEIYPLSMKIVLWIRGCFTKSFKIKHTAPQETYLEDINHIQKMTLTYGTQELLGKNLRAPNSRWAPTKSKLSKPCRWTAPFRGRHTRA